MIDLINSKKVFCPSCARQLEPQGKVHGNIAKVMAYCPICKVDYAWESCVDGNGSVTIRNFHHYQTSCNNTLCNNSNDCPHFKIN